MDLYHHIWYEKRYNGLHSCNECRGILLGTGLCCEVCSFRIHRTCQDKVKENCSEQNYAPENKDKELREHMSSPVIDDVLENHKNNDTDDYSHESDTNPLALSNHSHPPLEHFWVPGNVGIGHKCHVCHKSLAFKGFDASRCSRCYLSIHTSCQKEDVGVCIPPHEKFMLRTTDSPFLKEEDQTPLLVFINPRSGGQQGPYVLRKLRRLLSRAQVFDLTQGGPKPGLEFFKNVPRFKVLVCGGDGSVGWVLSQIDSFNFPEFPPLGVLPLGTGNDLAQALGWGAGYSGESLSSFLNSLALADPIPFDRWTIHSIPSNPDSPPLNKMMINYFSFGIDAKVALSFHLKREQNPKYFQNRLVNKGWYGRFGIENMLTRDGPIASFSDILLDDAVLDVPKKYFGIVILNIPSYGGGSDMWGKKPTTKFQLPSMNDGKFEVLGVKGTFHMGQIQAKMAQAKRLGQAKKISITTHRPVAAQVDGEPWILEPSTTTIEYFKTSTLLKKSSSSEIHISPTVSSAEMTTMQRTKSSPAKPLS